MHSYALNNFIKKITRKGKAANLEKPKFYRIYLFQLFCLYDIGCYCC